LPVAASSARITARWSPTISTGRAAAPVPNSVTVIAARTPAFASKNQCTQPVAASSE
jgi:hypothetical protein